jgi:hypothetical protein
LFHGRKLYRDFNSTICHTRNEVRVRLLVDSIVGREPSGLIGARFAFFSDQGAWSLWIR